MVFRASTSEFLFAHPCLLIMIGLIGGVLAAEQGSFMLPMFVISVYLAISAGKTKTKKAKSSRVFITFLFILFFIIGLLRINSFQKRPNLNDYFDSGEKACLSGYVSKITFSSDEYSYYLSDCYAEFVENTDPQCGEEGNKYLSAFGGIILVTNDGTAQIGDYISADGIIYPCERASNPGQFDALKYYRARNIEGHLYADKLSVLDNDGKLMSYVLNLIFDVSLKLRRGIERIFPEKEAGILTAMLTGEKGNIDADIKDSFAEIGIAHILSISGLHISLLCLGLFNILMKLTKRLKASSLITIGFMFFYGVLTGFSTSTTRAIIMVLCMLMARLLLKSYDGQNGAALAAIIILCMNPYSLFDSGFQLSFSAVYGIFAGNCLIKYLSIDNKLLKYIIPGAFAQLGSFPVVLCNYYSFSPYSFIANLVLLPFLSIILISGIMGAFFGSIFWITPGKISGGAAFYILKGYEKASEFILELPGAQKITGCPKVFSVVIYYFIFFLVICISRRVWWKNVKKDRLAEKEKEFSLRTVLIKMIPLVIIPLAFCLKRPENKEFEIDFLDVGQGMGIFVNQEDSRVLIDGGSANIKNVGKYRIEAFLKYKGIHELDAVFITHTDSDHISGIREIIEDGVISVGKIFLSKKTEDDDEFISLLESEQINYEMIDDSSAEIYGFRCIAPTERIIYPDKNSSSLVLLLEKDSFRTLFTGDSDFFSEYVYLSNIDEEINLLQAGHHGSKNSTSLELLTKLRPQTAVISCSRRNSYGHPSPELIERLEENGVKVYKTYENGMIKVTLRKNKFFVDGYLKE